MINIVIFDHTIRIATTNDVFAGGLLRDLRDVGRYAPLPVAVPFAVWPKPICHLPFDI